MKRYTLYPLVTIISIVVRQFLLPNPFNCFGDRALFLNHIAEPIIITLAYLIVGFVYKKGSNPVLGSVLFLKTYVAIIGVLWVFGIYRFAWWWILILLAVFSAFVILFRWLCNRPSKYDYYD